MQAINNYQSNASFTGGHFIMPQGCHKRFMRALRNECSTSDLITIRNIFENGINDRTKIILEDLGYMGGMEVDGHLCATINGKEYCNSWPLFAPSSWNIAKFIQKVASKGDKAEIKLLTQKSKDFLEKRRIATVYKRQKALEKAQTELECRQAKLDRNKGIVEEKEQRSYLLGEIYRLICGKIK